MNMKTSQEMLSSLLKTTQMGQIGIRSVLDAPMSPGIQKALHSQLKEYDAIETEDGQTVLEEYIDGITLAARISRQLLDGQEVVLP